MANPNIPNLTLNDTLNTFRTKFNQLLDSTSATDSDFRIISDRVDSINNTQLVSAKMRLFDSTAANDIRGRLTVGKNATFENDVQVDGSITVDSNFTVGGEFTVAGEFNIQTQYIGFLTGVESDLGNPTLNAGLNVDRGGEDSAVFQWNEANDYWEAGTKDSLYRLALQGDSATFDNVRIHNYILRNVPSESRRIQVIADSGVDGAGYVSLLANGDIESKNPTIGITALTNFLQGGVVRVTGGKEIDLQTFYGDIIIDPQRYIQLGDKSAISPDRSSGLILDTQYAGSMDKRARIYHMGADDSADDGAYIQWDYVPTTEASPESKLTYQADSHYLVGSVDVSGNLTVDGQINSTGGLVFNGDISIQDDGNEHLLIRNSAGFGTIIDADSNLLLVADEKVIIGSYYDNTITFRDTPGNEQVKFDFTNASLSTITGDRDTTVDIDGDLTLNGDAVTVQATQGSIPVVNLKNASSNAIQFQLGTNPEMEVTGNFALDVSGDIIIDADGSQIYLQDGGATRYTFNLDATPSLDVTGAFTLSSTASATIDTQNALTLQTNIGSGNNITLDAGDNISLEASGDIDIKTADASGGTLNFYSSSADVYFVDGNTPNNIGIAFDNVGRSFPTINLYGSGIVDALTGDLSLKASQSSGTTGKVYLDPYSGIVDISRNGNQHMVRLNCGQAGGKFIVQTGATNYFYAFEVDQNGNGTFAGDVTAYGTVSDRRQKENIVKIDNALDKVNSLNGYTFNYIGNEDRLTGVMAQEVAEVLPEAVYETKAFEQEETTMAVRHGNMVGLLIEAIKELKAEIEELKNGR